MSLLVEQDLMIPRWEIAEEGPIKEGEKDRETKGAVSKDNHSPKPETIGNQKQCQIIIAIYDFTTKIKSKK